MPYEPTGGYVTDIGLPGYATDNNVDQEQGEGFFAQLYNTMDEQRLQEEAMADLLRGVAEDVTAGNMSYAQASLFLSNEFGTSIPIDAVQDYVTKYQESDFMTNPLLNDTTSTLGTFDGVIPDNILDQMAVIETDYNNGDISIAEKAFKEVTLLTQDALNRWGAEEAAKTANGVFSAYGINTSFDANNVLATNGGLDLSTDNDGLISTRFSNLDDSSGGASSSTVLNSVIGSLGGGGSQGGSNTGGPTGGTDDSQQGTEEDWIYEGEGVFRNTNTGATDYYEPAKTNDAYVIGQTYSRPTEDDTDPGTTNPGDNVWISVGNGTFRNEGTGEVSDLRGIYNVPGELVTGGKYTVDGDGNLTIARNGTGDDGTGPGDGPGDQNGTGGGGETPTDPTGSGTTGDVVTTNTSNSNTTTTNTSNTNNTVNNRSSTNYNDNSYYSSVGDYFSSYVGDTNMTDNRQDNRALDLTLDFSRSGGVGQLFEPELKKLRKADISDYIKPLRRRRLG